MTRRPLVVTVALVVLASGLAACSSGGDAVTGASASATSNVQQTLELSRRFSQCAREHGYPNFPDPVIDGDQVVYHDDTPDLKDQLNAVGEIPECKAISDQIRRGGNSNPTPSAADLQKLRDFAKCMREHGLPEWPDPKPDGTFPITGTPLENEGKSERFFAAVDVCKQYYDKRIATS